MEKEADGEERREEKRRSRLRYKKQNLTKGVRKKLLDTCNKHN